MRAFPILPRLIIGLLAPVAMHFIVFFGGEFFSGNCMCGLCFRGTERGGCGLSFNLCALSCAEIENADMVSAILRVHAGHGLTKRPLTLSAKEGEWGGKQEGSPEAGSTRVRQGRGRREARGLTESNGKEIGVPLA